jgi:hypothetical protein
MAWHDTLKIQMKPKLCDERSQIQMAGLEKLPGSSSLFSVTKVWDERSQNQMDG